MVVQYKIHISKQSLFLTSFVSKLDIVVSHFRTLQADVNVCVITSVAQGSYTEPWVYPTFCLGRQDLRFYIATAARAIYVLSVSNKLLFNVTFDFNLTKVFKYIFYNTWKKCLKHG